MLAVPVLLSVPTVRQLLRVPMFPMSVLPHRAPAPFMVLLRDARFTPFCLYLATMALGLLSCAPLVRLLHVLPVVFTSGHRAAVGGDIGGVVGGGVGVVAAVGSLSIVGLLLGKGLQIMMLLVVVVVVVLMLVVGVLHVGFLQLMVLVGGRMLLRLLADIKMPLIGWLLVLIVLLLVL
jgi:hypothetical protein